MLAALLHICSPPSVALASAALLRLWRPNLILSQAPLRRASMPATHSSADDGGECGGQPAEQQHADACEQPSWAARKGLAHRFAVSCSDTFLDWYASCVTLSVALVTLETLLLCIMSALAVTFFCRWFSDNGAAEFRARCCCAASHSERSVSRAAGRALQRASCCCAACARPIAALRVLLSLALWQRKRTRALACLGARLAANINWTFFSFAVVLPLTFLLNEAFRRRELALNTLAQMKARARERGDAQGGVVIIPSLSVVALAAPFALLRIVAASCARQAEAGRRRRMVSCANDAHVVASHAAAVTRATL
jgi:hypothetical protein